MATFTYNCSPASRMQRSALITKAVFGNGYTQRVGEGVNNMPRTWDVVFDARSVATTNAIEAFLITHDQGQPFDWTPPVGAAGRFTCDRWRRGYSGYDKNVITAQFMEDFSP